MSIKLEKLDGRSGDNIPALFFKKPSDIKNILDNGYAATSADGGGAINIWMDDDDNIRCESMRYLVSLEKKTYDNIEDVKIWAKKWLTKIK